MNIGIVGSRDFTNYELFRSLIDEYLKNTIVNNIFSGGARGVDSLAERYSLERLNKPAIVYKPNTNEYKEKGNKIYYERNMKIILNSDLVIAFQINNSKGTQMSINLAIEQHKTVKIFKFNTQSY